MSDFKLQVSGSIGETYFILHADSGEELVEKSAELAASMDATLENLAAVKQVLMAKEVFTAKKAAAPAAAKPAAAAASAPATPPPGGAKTCAHGDMEYKAGTSKAGNAYKMWACTAPRDEQCKAVFLK